MTRRREWPNSAMVARDEAAEALQDIITNLRPLLRINGDGVTRTEIIARTANAIDKAQTGIRWLESVGAPTVPREG